MPLIVVYTKFDLVSSVERVGKGEGEEFSERNYKNKYGGVIERPATHDALRLIPYAVVTSTSTFGLLRLH